MHASNPNRSTRRRCGLVACYISPAVRQVSPDSYGTSRCWSAAATAITTFRRAKRRSDPRSDRRPVNYVPFGRAVELGINLLDVADVYGGGDNERGGRARYASWAAGTG